MEHLRTILIFMSMAMLLPAVAHANAGPPIVLAFSFHLMFVTWIIGIGEGLLLSALFRTWKSRIFISMIAANFASAFFGMWFVRSTIATHIMGDLTIENLGSVFWTMVYVTFVLTMIIEFPFFVYALYGRKWLVPKAAAATLLAHCIGYTLIFGFYGGESTMSMVTQLEVVPVTDFEIEEDYDLYYISPDGKQVLRSDLAGNEPEVIAAFDVADIPKRLCACPRKVVVEKAPDDNPHSAWETIQQVFWESGFDLCVIVDINGKNETKVLVENFSPRAAIDLWDGKYVGHCEGKNQNWPNDGDFRSLGTTAKWEFSCEFWGCLRIAKLTQEQQPYTPRVSTLPPRSRYLVHTPFVQWTVENGSHIAGDYAVFKLGKDQICILDPEKKQIALIARGFGPVVAKPPLASGELVPATPEEAPQDSIQTSESISQAL